MAQSAFHTNKVNILLALSQNVNYFLPSLLYNKAVYENHAMNEGILYLNKPEEHNVSFKLEPEQLTECLHPQLHILSPSHEMGDVPIHYQSTQKLSLPQAT